MSGFRMGPSAPGPLTLPSAMAFIDAGYLKRQTVRLLKIGGSVILDGAGIATWAAQALKASGPSRFLRAYVYDGEYEHDHSCYAAQRAQFDALASAASIRLQLGHIVDGASGARQKGVDTRLVLDLVRLAGLSAFDTAILVAGDRDFELAVKVVADDYARRVVLFTPDKNSVSKELVQVCDEHRFIEEAFLRGMVVPVGEDQMCDLSAEPAAREEP